MQGAAEARELWNYQLYLVAGGVMAWHYEQVDAWLRSHSGKVVVSTVIALAVAEGFYLAAHLEWVRGLGGVSPSDPFQPTTVPLTLCLIADIYLLGVMATDRRRSARVRAGVRLGADNCYGVYLSQVIFIAFLVTLRWRHLETLLPWPLVVLGAVVIVFISASVLTAILARLPGAQATAGRRRVRPRLSQVSSA
jgi:peptidoglycan/LPS O-acetylase OafA/YrhL